MAAPSKRSSPAVQLRERLIIARQADLDFDMAWDRAWARIRWPHDTQHRRDWKKAIAWSRASWERAYGGEFCDASGSMRGIELVA